ncbi:SCO6745 family protein [Nonomuraea dietziae]|uniref:SCO6745 family protein n=1 Tax=Nonomuraea dietziae TaxID=65515 RepID=UPI0033FD3FB4
MEEIWRRLEGYHAIVYFAPETEAVYAAAGLKGFWMGYFATRSAALGAVSADVVTASFYNFAPARVARALPDAWAFCSPETALKARLKVVDQSLRRLVGDLVADQLTAEAAALARRAVEASPRAGRTLFAAHAVLPVPAEPHLELWWAATALREFRGDGHIAALLAAGLDGCEANVMSVAMGVAPQQQRDYRGWTEQEWTAATDRLRDRGWLAADGTLSAEGRRRRDAVEATTEELAKPALAALGPEGISRLTECLHPLIQRIVDGDAIPFPNAMGLPRIRLSSG